ncbi:class I SAM-dependent methyltransferase [Paenibacillus sp. CGMCC 1.16610]|uniref:Methyltransferase domain-containing protein n=1 Tax=Paenibacillus anseongense TaxID=2682845 RepID=A0ABW9UJG9_9BACL|nr:MULTISPECIES: class I SAM-dependent methyltransferase [Paenibacillus]MBA2941532.1 class I SAM-dependent methyltransferase [Paenibacillus sp. CGMCC 1.16610]MVQ40347.1 methyltransferase domain-containing protein [Paenibacillus anseongense]
MTDKNNNQLITKFDEVAEKYDGQRRKLIPCFDDFYGTATSLVQPRAAEPRILDLGAGTGLLSSYILGQYPDAKVTLIDLSQGMLDIAKLRFGEMNANLTIQAGDYTAFESDEPFDCVVSALSIHHLEDQAKQNLYERIFKLLKPGGIFVNADQVLGRSPFLDHLYRADWEAKIEATDLTREALQAAYERTKLDKMAPLDQQLAWLKASGFADVDCVYKYYNFVVMFAQKPEA